MLRYDRQTKPGLVALYIWPRNGAGPFLQPRSPHGAQNSASISHFSNSCHLLQNMTHIPQQPNQWSKPMALESNSKFSVSYADTTGMFLKTTMILFTNI